jgi:hypothetical protein
VRFFHSGDFGDILYAVPSMRALCAETGTLAHVYLGSRDWTRSAWNPTLVSVIAPLLKAQDFVEHVTLIYPHELPPSPFVDFSTFRNGGYKTGDTILERQRRWVQADIDISSPWLQVPQPKRMAGLIAVNRGKRWRGLSFPWRELLGLYHQRMFFTGLPEEHTEFCHEFGLIDFTPTKDLLEAARLIAGADFFMGNQSACNAIANGLHKPSLIEACFFAPDCFLSREDTSFCLDGAVDLKLFGRVLKTPPEHRALNEVEEKLLANARKALSHCSRILVH